MANGMSDLLQNKLFLQYLAGAGQDIGSGNAIGTNVNAVTNQAITAQNFSKLLAQLMADANDSTTPGKVTTDGKKLTYNTELGMSDLGKSLFPDTAGAAGAGGKVGINPFR